MRLKQGLMCSIKVSPAAMKTNGTLVRPEPCHTSPVNLAHFGVQPATNCNRDETTCSHSGKGSQTTY